MLLLFLPTTRGSGQTFDQITRPMVEITDPVVIDDVLSELLIVAPDSLEALRLVDITANGYGPDDLVILIPGQRVYVLDTYVPMTLQRLMRTWVFEADFRQESQQGDEESILVDAHLSEHAESVIASACVDAIADHYSGDDMHLLVERNDGTARVSMWNYDPMNLRYDADASDGVCAVQTQRFEFAEPITVTAFRDQAQCLEVWTDRGKVTTRRCADL